MPTHRARRSLASRLTLALLLSGFAAAVVLAAAPSFWRLENQSDFLPGDTDGVSIDSDGVITLAPATQVVAEPTEPHLWSLAIDRSGNVYAGSGNEGMVFRVTPSGEMTTVTDTEDLQVQAIAIDRRNNIYVATSPGGAVYKLGEGDRRDVFFDPEERYVWALAVDSLGNLIVATGDPARIYRVSSSGESQQLFASEETHVVSLAVDGNDNIYAGTESNGLVLRIDRNGASSVLFDTPFQEVRAVVADTRGNVFAATVNGGARPSSPPTAVTTTSAPPSPTVSAGGASVTVTATANVSASTSSSPSSSSASSGSLVGALYRIDPDGAADQLWQSRSDMPLSLALARDDRLMVGTGSDGRMYLVGQDKTSSLLLSVDADQITAISPGPDGQTYLATSNPAKIYRVNRGRRTEGIYRSPTMDTETVSAWGKIRWEARAPSGTTIKLQSRSGNSAEPDNTWSDWSEAYTESAGQQVTSPKGRFFQWRAVLNSTGELSPELRNVTAIYLQQNLAPQISNINVYPPGQAFQKPIVATGQIDVLGMDETLVDESAPTGMMGQPGAASMSVTAMARPLFRKGIQTVTWSAEDPNDDDLTFDVQYRAEGETLWRTLREGLTSPVIAWDTVAMPDGRYTLRIVASDVLSNPEELVKTSEKTSRSFEVDNTPPSVTGLAAAAEGQGYRVRFTAADAISPVQTVEYAINSGTWRVVFPTDGIADSPQESFDFQIPSPGEGVFTLVVKVTDKLGNTGTARTELR